MFEVARSNNLGMPQHIYNKPDEYEWGLIFDNGEVFSRVDIPDRALLKNEIKKALAYKRLQAQRQEQRPEGLSDAIMAMEVNKTLAKQCPECGRILGEHSEEELIRCIRQGT
jgi:hypothetical protein